MVSMSKNFFVHVKSMNLMYFINFKVFLNSHPFRRKMHTKLKLQMENGPGLFFHLACFLSPTFCVVPEFLTLTLNCRATKCDLQKL